MGSFYWIQRKGKSILCTSEGDSVYCWDFRMTESSIKSILIYECFSQSDDFIPIRSRQAELKLLDMNSRQILVSSIEDWREVMCSHATFVEKITPDQNFAQNLLPSTKMTEIAINDEHTRILAIGKRQVSALTLSKPDYGLSIDKSWTFRTDSIKIIYEAFGTVLFLNSFGQLCSTDWSQQSAIQQISSDAFVDMLVLKEEAETVVLVALSTEKVELLKITEFKEIIERCIISTSIPINQVLLFNGAFIVQSQNVAEVYQFSSLSEISSIVASKQMLQCASSHMSFFEGVFTYLVKEGQQYSIHGLQQQTCIKLQVADSSFTVDRDTFGSSNYLGANLKSIFGSSITIFKDYCHLVHLCRNSFGNVLDMKYAVIAGIEYFLSLHCNFFLIFSLKATPSGSIEPFLLKSVALPTGEFSSSRCSISVIGNSRIFIRNECNAYEISVGNEVNAADWSNHALDSSFKLLPAVFGLLQGQEIDEELVRLICTNPADKQAELLKLVLQIFIGTQYAMDQFGFNALISILLHVEAKQRSISLSSVGDLRSYGLVSALKSDSEQLLIDQCLTISGDKLTFEWFEVFQFGFWVKNLETLVNHG